MSKTLLALILTCCCAMAQVVISGGATLSGGVVVPAPTAGGTPSYVRADTNGGSTSDTTTDTITITSDITAGQRIVVFAECINASQNISGVTDDDGNTYTIHEERKYNTTQGIAIASAVAGSTLSSGEQITLTWETPGYTYRHWAVFVCDDADNAVDQSAQNSAYGTAVTASDTVSATSVGMGMLLTPSSKTYSGDWTTIGTYTDWGGGTWRSYYYYTEAGSGTWDPGGTISGNDDWGVVWAAFR